ncbi:MAG: hypothetical protein NC818_05220 [Candidatus Omnitrophica bacterium]|nr:hypothetical protein [Candidatus Omnitrophota bacterium]
MVKNFIKREGFTFIELFSIILLITFLVTIAIPRFRSTFSTLELANFSKKISTLLRFAQSKAIAEGVEIYFLKEKNLLFLTKDPPQNTSGGREILEGRFSLTIPQAIKVIFSGAREFVFRHDGSIDFIERDKESSQSPKIIVSNERTKFQIIPQGVIGRITLEEVYEVYE